MDLQHSGGSAWIHQTKVKEGKEEKFPYVGYLIAVEFKVIIKLCTNECDQLLIFR
jgi:hypothetical protein